MDYRMHPDQEHPEVKTHRGDAFTALSSKSWRSSNQQAQSWAVHGPSPTHLCSECAQPHCTGLPHHADSQVEICSSPTSPPPPVLTAHRGSRPPGCSRCPAAGSCHQHPPPAAASPQSLEWCPHGRWAALPWPRQLCLHRCHWTQHGGGAAEINRMCSHFSASAKGKAALREEWRTNIASFAFCSSTGFFFPCHFLSSCFAGCDSITGISQPTLPRCPCSAHAGCGAWHELKCWQKGGK